MYLLLRKTTHKIQNKKKKKVKRKEEREREKKIRGVCVSKRDPFFLYMIYNINDYLPRNKKKYFNNLTSWSELGFFDYQYNLLCSEYNEMIYLGASRNN